MLDLNSDVAHRRVGERRPQGPAPTSRVSRRYYPETLGNRSLEVRGPMALPAKSRVSRDLELKRMPNLDTCEFDDLRLSQCRPLPAK